MIDRYPGSGPAASACLLLAAQQRAKKNYTEANATLHKFIDQFPKHELITTAWMGVAANLESLGKNDEALSTYQRLASEYPQSFNAPLALLAEVPLMKAKNRNDEARRVCETIISQYRDSIVGERSDAGIDFVAETGNRTGNNAARRRRRPSRWPAHRSAPSPAAPPKSGNVITSTLPVARDLAVATSRETALTVESSALVRPGGALASSGRRGGITAWRTGSACARPAGRTSSVPSSADRA